MTTDEIVGVMLVAGKSERMGGSVPKQLLPFGDRTMAARSVANAEASRLDRIVAVTGAEADRVAASVTACRTTLVHNPDYARGNVTSLLKGIAAAGAPGAVLLLLGDMPGVTPDIIDRFVEVWGEDRPWAAVAVYDDGVPNHPFLLSAAAIGAMTEMATAGSKVLWRLLIEAPPRPVVEVRFARPAPVDVDTLDEYHAALRQLGLAVPEG
jgi:CTP:molybdopterin cytidylyltransferase MocA